MVSCIQPCKASSQSFYLQSSSVQIFVINACDLNFTSCRRLHIFCDLHYIIVVEVKSRNRIIGLRMLRFFLNGKSLAVFVKLYYAVLSGISYIITEDSCSLFLFCSLICILKNSGKALSVKNIIAQNKGNCIVSDKVRSNDKCVCQSSRLFLNRILKTHSKLLSVSQKLFKHRKISWCGNDQNFSDPCQHQSGKGIVDHGLVIHRHDLLGNRLCQWI